MAPKKLKWSGRGHADRVSECGNYKVVIVEFGCRHDPGPYWAAEWKDPEANSGFQWRMLEGSGKIYHRSTVGFSLDYSGGLLQEAKDSAQVHANEASP